MLQPRSRNLAHAISTVLASSSLYASYGHAQAQPQQSGEGGPLDTVIVTGTRREDRTIADSPVPIDVLGGPALENQGFTETNRVLNTLVPSFNFPQPSITDGTDVIRPATLRGLSPDQTLVLVNGKRRHPTALLNINGSVGRGSAAVDLNMIPAAAIERIEVLRDGAAAQYGSDAIAGVINIVLKSTATGGGISTSYGQYMTTLDGVREIRGLQTDSAGQPVIAPDGVYAMLPGDERSVTDGETWSVSGNWGLPLADQGFINLTAEYRDRNPTNRTGPDPRRQYQLVGTAADPRELTFNRINHRYGDAATEDLNIFINGGFNLTDAVELYTFASYGQREGESAGFFRRPGVPTSGAGSTNTDVRNRNWTASTTTFVPYYANGFLPLITSDIEDYSIAAGAKGAVGEWDWDASIVHGSDEFDFGVENSLNTSFGSTSQNEFDAGNLGFAQETINLDARRLFTPGWVQSSSLAFGLEYRRENFEISPGELQSYAGGPFAANGAPAGAQVFPGFRTPIDQSRNSRSLYVDLDTDVSERWNVDLAARYEDYSDFGSELTGKIASRFSFSETVSVRGAISTGFRAPSLHQQYYQTSSTNLVGTTLVEIGTFPVSDPVARALGAQDLEPETSVNYSLGVVLNPLDNLSVSLDFYRIDLDDRIVVTENLEGAAVVALLQSAGFNNITSARFFINGVDTKTDGFDLVGTYRTDLPFGQLNLTAAYNYNKTEIEQLIAAQGPLATIPNLVLFGYQERERFVNGQPRDKIALSGDWSLDRFSATLRGTRFGDVLSPGTFEDGRDDVELSAKWVVDLEARFAPTDSWQIAIGANNLLDEYPDANPLGLRQAPFTGSYSANNYFTPYSSFSPFGFNGRFVYGRVNFNW
jgi:iron complex outermembrane recepter protein